MNNSLPRKYFHNNPPIFCLRTFQNPPARVSAHQLPWYWHMAARLAGAIVLDIPGVDAAISHPPRSEAPRVASFSLISLITDNDYGIPAQRHIFVRGEWVDRKACRNVKTNKSFVASKHANGYPFCRKTRAWMVAGSALLDATHSVCLRNEFSPSYSATPSYVVQQRARAIPTSCVRTTPTVFTSSRQSLVDLNH